jgi:hypothetical protein
VVDTFLEAERTFKNKAFNMYRIYLCHHCPKPIPVAMIVGRSLLALLALWRHLTGHWSIRTTVIEDCAWSAQADDPTMRHGQYSRL